MKITREIIDNGQKIVHVNYEKKDIEEMKKRHEEEMAKQKAEEAKKQNNMTEDQTEDAAIAENT